jgi:hypothetical protein
MFTKFFKFFKGSAVATAAIVNACCSLQELFLIPAVAYSGDFESLLWPTVAILLNYNSFTIWRKYKEYNSTSLLQPKDMILNLCCSLQCLL